MYGFDLISIRDNDPALGVIPDLINNSALLSEYICLLFLLMFFGVSQTSSSLFPKYIFTHN